MLLALCLLPIPVAYAEGGGGGGDSGGGGGSTTNYYVTVNGGQNSLGHADSVDVSTSITNITADNVTVYVEGDYNPTHLYYPKVSELHVANNTNGALWNPTTDELSNTLHSAVMKSAGLSILYDGWVDLENSGTQKPEGATREGEILGYDIYAKLGEKYVPVEEVSTYDKDGNPVMAPVAYTYENGGVYSGGDRINYTWAVTQLYRAMGVEQVEYCVITEGRNPKDYDINSSPLAQFITMATKGVDLSAVISNVYATRTNPDTYLKMAESDCLGVVPSANREDQYMTLGEFCLLAYMLMDLYGEPVLTEAETYMLLEAYGQALPYGLPEVQLEAVKYLLARGIIESDMDWRSDITFADATTILMRIKDKNSRLTFKEIQLTTDVGLLSRGYYPTTVSAYNNPIEITNEFVGYDSYNSFDYFVEITDATEFRAEGRTSALPFIGAGQDNDDGVMAGTLYMGRVDVNGRKFYHFRVERVMDSIAVQSGRIYINTANSTDIPARYQLPVPSGGNVGGYYTCSSSEIGELTSTSTVSAWEWHTLDEGSFPEEYLDAARLEANVNSYDTQLGLFNESSYGFSFRVSISELDKVMFKTAAGDSKTLKDVLKSVKIELGNNMSVIRTDDASSQYATFEVLGCSNRNTLSDIFQCSDGTSYQAFPAFAYQNNRYLVSVDYLKSIGAAWEFTKMSDSSYYLGVKSSGSLYTDVYIYTTTSSSCVIRGSQCTIYPQDVAVVVEADTGYYVDYSAILGVSSMVGFNNENGEVTLVKENGHASMAVTAVSNTNNKNSGTGMSVSQEYVANVTVKNDSGEKCPYIYCPVTYPLANWLTVTDFSSGRQGVFTFFAKDPNVEKSSEKSEGEVVLESLLGKQAPQEWAVSFTSMPPIGAVGVKYSSSDSCYTISGKEFPDIAYIEEYDAFLIKPQEWSGTYGDFVKADKSVMVSSFLRIDGTLYDWNYNWYQASVLTEYSATEVRHIVGNANHFCDLSSYAGGYTFPESCHGRTSTYINWVPAPVGVPGLIGSPTSLSQSLVSRSNVNTYSGICYAVRNAEGGQLLGDGESAFSEGRTSFSLIHATPNKMWLQSCGFGFATMAGSALGESAPTSTKINSGDATAGFDWEQFFHDIGIQNADDWLTIAIIAVLNILPRIFMFAFIILMGLSLIANVKPWQAFCDSVFDPYKLLTFGRQDVHTIKLKMVVLYSIIALALFGLFQNGIILEVIAWVARAVTGILSR